MKIVSKASMERIQKDLATMYEVITTSVYAEQNRVPIPTFVALSACLANISEELEINLLANELD